MESVIFMGFRISWYIEKRVISLKFSEAITERDLIQAIQQTTDYIEHGIPPIYNVIDTLDITEFPTNLRWILQVMRRNKAGLMSWNILITSNRTIQFLGTTFLQLLNVQIHTCANFAEAEAFLRQADPALFTAPNGSK
ncbi:MAG TPA: hypothetical protein VHD90_22875 [Phototrophicaceae bacterium]|nr:hypothetical protein [Phototrophicaceae bacterium]